MVDLTLHDYGVQRDSGSPSMLGKIADTAVDAVCNIYYKSPGFILQQEINGVPPLDGVRAFYDNLCALKNKAPALPAPPFHGGQCNNLIYNVNGSYVITAFGTTNHYTSPGLEGKIGGVGVRPVPGTSPQAYAVFVEYGIGSASGTRYFQVSGQDYNSGLFASPTIDSITVTGGGADTCGDIPYKYPTTPLVNSDVNFNTNINITPSVSITVPVTVIPTFVAVANVFRPEFNVKVGDIIVNGSLGGFTFAPTVQISPGTTTPSGDPRALPPPAKTNDPTTDPKQVGTDLTDIKTRLDKIETEIENCCEALAPFPEPPSDKIRILLLATGNSMDVAIPSKTFKVTLELTQMATNKKVQFGNDAPDVLYAGWAWFSDGVRQYERLPVDSQYKFYIPPERAGKRFCCTLYPGYVARVLAYYIN